MIPMKVLVFWFMAAIVGACIGMATGCASSKHMWYEHPGIVLGGVGYGAVVGPENVAIRESERRAVKNGTRKWADEFVPTYFMGSILHVATGITLFVLVPPIGWGYIGLSSFVGGAQFYKLNAWDGDNFK